MAKHIYIILIFIVGFAIKPSVGFACASKSEKVCVKDASSSRLLSDIGCENHDRFTHEKKECKGKCCEKSCGCITFHTSIVIIFAKQADQRYIGESIDTYKNNELAAYPSSGFYSIWIPPNLA